ncbi:MAG: Na+:solute symporter [Microscillaceae bacterium]|nr:Na+:solute symporter [Microscillaceae bacterium]
MTPGRRARIRPAFFWGGRNLPWWIAGTSMVATTFAADTPLLVTELVANYGVSGNWLWWNGLIGGMITTFFFARLWRRANILTDVALIELRYGTGPAARFLRGFKAVYLGVLLNSVIIAWVNIALGKLLMGFFEVPPQHLGWYYLLAMLLVGVYSGLSGLLGVAMTDFVQFITAMLGTVVLAFLVVNSEKIGGLAGLKAALPAQTFQFWPQIDFSGEGLLQTSQVLVISGATFLSYIGFQWWASWYPGAEPGGGGYVAQRMMSTPREKDALKATLLFQVMHYAVRPLPWILVGLASVVLYPELPEKEKGLGYVFAMRDFLPDGWRGLLLAAFLAAYMSTISTQLNWGSSYLIHDLYQRFVHPQASERQLVLFSRLSTLVLIVCAWGVTTQMQTLEGAFRFMVNAGAGLGAVLMLRWYWWRINAWSELSATFAPLIAYSVALFAWKWDDTSAFFLSIGFTTLVWLLITFLTRPVPMAQLRIFCQQVAPTGFWHPVWRDLGQAPPVAQTGGLLGASLGALLMAFGALFTAGALLF